MEERGIWFWPLMFFRTVGLILGVPVYKKRVSLEVNPSDLGLDYTDISFYSRRCKERVLLRGWYLPAGNKDKCIIMIHGWGGNRAHSEIGMLEIAKELVAREYDVLTFDLRAHGESGGNKTSYGYYETYDVLGAYDFVVNKKGIGPQNIGLFGFSYGAMISIFAANKEKIRAVVLDSGPGDSFGFLRREIAKRRLPAFLFDIAGWLMKALLKIDPDALDTRRVIKKMTTPMFFIHGTKDFIPYSSVQEFYQLKARNPLDRIWIVSDVWHGQAYKTHPEGYIKKVAEFFNETLKPAS